MSRPGRPGLRLGFAWGLIAALVVPASGCRHEGREETEQVLHAIDALRDSPADALETREKLIGELEGLPVRGEAAAHVRELCAKAYRLLVDGRKIEAHIREELDKPADPSLNLAADLIQAEANIKSSAAVMPDCDRGAAHLHEALRR